MRNTKNHDEVIVFQSRNGMPQMAVQFKDETAWLSVQQIADLFWISAKDVVELIRHIYHDGELARGTTCRVCKEGNLDSSDKITQYNLDMMKAENSGYTILKKQL